ncbi:uncharacterized protein LOC103316763 isoform X2 [Nasonia vitripennis]|uniref:Uncharacterized protein n=1 Tax=Nasonia vitripennis TaxID=7425 RepID=A0A7M7Q7W9_NASVI|nr:uncharacterized protein LOC103316763 isoform X2 [Nasonia vitripennis]
MEPFLDDYLFPILPVSGWKITIFSPSDYPDNTSGGVSDALISPQTENFLELNGDSFFSEKAVHNVDIEQRKCIFHSDAAALYDSYTYSDCIVNCRVNDIHATCGCRPFVYPRRSNIGGICGVLIGFSLISAFEFVYFLVLSILALLKSRHPNENQDKSYPMRPIFWDELAPRGKTRNTHAEETSPRSLKITVKQRSVRFLISFRGITGRRKGENKSIRLAYRSLIRSSTKRRK